MKYLCLTLLLTSISFLSFAQKSILTTVKGQDVLVDSIKRNDSNRYTVFYKMISESDRNLYGDHTLTTSRDSLAVLFPNTVIKRFLGSAIVDQITDKQMGIVSMEDIPGTRVKILTVVESIVPSGIGRSRIIESTTLIDAEQLTTSRTDGTDTKQGSVSRRQNKAPSQKETKLLNLFNVGGINFQNIATNDAILTSKITGLLIEGWDLKFVNSAVESNAGEDDATGIFLTRYIFIK